MPLLLFQSGRVSVDEQSYEDKDRHRKINDQEIRCKMNDEELHWKRGHYHRSIEVVFRRTET